MANDLNDLFERDPLTLTKDDFQSLVDQLRAERAAFLAAGEDGKKHAKAKAKANAKNLTLGDLGL